MSYVPLALTCSDPRVCAVIGAATEPHLREAHYLLATAHPIDGGADAIQFGLAAAMLTVTALSGASVVRHFDPEQNQPAHRADRSNFLDCVEKFFPWAHVSVDDQEGRFGLPLRKAAALALYCSFRSPLVHSGGMAAKGFQRLEMCHVFPGLATFAENESQIVELCQRESCAGQTWMELHPDRIRIHTRPFYWAVRRLVESMAADASVQADISSNFNF